MMKVSLLIVLVFSCLPYITVSAVSSRTEHDSLDPPFWDEALTLDELPLDKATGARVLDPWVYTQRLGAMKTLLEKTNAAYPCLFPETKANVLWGLPLQFGWQRSSERLFINASSSNQTLTSDSWWADMNYQLTIVPVLGALASNTVLQNYHIHTLSNKERSDRFCVNYTHDSQLSPACKKMSESLSKWTTFFSSLPTLEANCTGETSETGKLLAYDKTIANLWDAHTASLHEGVIAMNDTLALLPSTEEGNFGVSWANLVEFIAATHFPTAFNETTDQQSLLPTRMLQTGDKPGHISDMSKATNRCLVMINELQAGNERSNGELLVLWKRAMCTQKGRALGRDMIERGIRNPLVLVKDMKALIKVLISVPCDKGS